MIPGQSEVRSYTTDHLESGAQHLDETAGNWEAVYTRVKDQLHSIGWQGDAAEAAMTASHTDLLKVAGHADHLRSVAKTALRAADDLRWMQRDIMHAVADIGDQGFTVGEDWSVTDRAGNRSYSALTRAAQAQALATELGTKVAAFMAQETATGAALTGAAATLATVQTNFPPKHHSDIQMLDTGPGPDNIAPWDMPGQGVPPLPQMPGLPGVPADSVMRQAMTPGPRPSVPPMPHSPPLPPTGPDSQACKDKWNQEQQQRLDKVWEKGLAGAALGGMGGAVEGGVGAIPGAIEGGAGGLILGGIDYATDPHPTPPECK